MWLGEQDQYTASAFASLLQTGELNRKGHMEALAYPLDLKAIAAALLAGSELTQRLFSRVCGSSKTLCLLDL